MGEGRALMATNARSRSGLDSRMFPLIRPGGYRGPAPKVRLQALSRGGQHTPPIPPVSGGVDPAALLAEVRRMLAARQAPAGGHAEYRPYEGAEVDLPNPLWLAGGVLGSQAGALPVPPSSGLRVRFPSLAEERASAEAGAARTAPSEGEREAERLKALSNLYKAKAEMARLHPLPERSLPEEEAYPVRETLARPEAASPRVNPMGAILAGLTGLADPGSAGFYASAPLEAGIAAAERDKEERLAQWRAASEQMAQEYEDALAARNERLHRARSLAETEYQNALSRSQDARGAAEMEAEGRSASERAAGLLAPGGLADRERSAALLGLRGSQLDRTIGEQLAANAAAAKAELEAAKNETNLLKSQLMFGANIYRDQSRERIGEGSNAARLGAASIRAQGSVAAAQVRAEASVKAASARMSRPALQRLLPGDREMVQAAWRNYANAEAAFGRGLKDAEAAYADLAVLTPAEQMPEKEGYVLSYTSRLSARAEALKEAALSADAEAKARAGVSGASVPSRTEPLALFRSLVGEFGRLGQAAAKRFRGQAAGGKKRSTPPNPPASRGAGKAKTLIYDPKSGQFTER